MASDEGTPLLNTPESGEETEFHDPQTNTNHTRSVSYGGDSDIDDDDDDNSSRDGSGKGDKGLMTSKSYGTEMTARTDGTTKTKGKKPQMNGVRLTSRSALVLEAAIEMNMTKHNIAHEYFQFKQFFFFTLPMAVLTAVSGVLAFSASSKMMSQYSDIISLVVGCLSAFVVLLQTNSGTLGFGFKADRHQSCAIALRDLRDDMTMIGLKLENIEEMQEKKLLSKHGDYTDGGSETFSDIQKRYKQCLAGCNSTVPLAITEAYHGLDSNVDLFQTSKNREYWNEIYPDVDYKTVMRTKAYDILGGEIINGFMYPLVLPSSKKTVARTMAKLKERMSASVTYTKEIYEAKEQKWCGLV